MKLPSSIGRVYWNKTNKRLDYSALGEASVWLTIDFVRSGRLEIGGGGGELGGSSSINGSSFARLSLICKLCCVDDSLTVWCIWPLLWDSESVVGVLLGVLLKWLSDDATKTGYFLVEFLKQTLPLTWIGCGCGVHHVLGAGPLLAAVLEPIQDIENRLRVLLLLLLAYVGAHQQASPCFRHPLYEWIVKKAFGMLVTSANVRRSE